MIHISDKSCCCGCTACVAVCPKKKYSFALPYIFGRCFYESIPFQYKFAPFVLCLSGQEREIGGDITLGDFWGVERVLPEFDDDKGVSVVLGFTEKGKQLLEAVLPYERLSVDYATAIACNPSMLVSVNRPRCRDFFLHRLLKQGYGFDRALDDALEMRPLKRARRLLFYWLGY